MIFNNRIKAFRLDAGMTIEQLADESGVNKDTISRAENGVTNPNLLTIYWLSKSLNCHPFDLVDFSQGATKTESLSKICKKEKVDRASLISTQDFVNIYCRGNYD